MTPEFIQALGFMILMAAMTAGGQVLIKLGLNKTRPVPGLPRMIRACGHPAVLAGLFLALGAPLIYLKALALLGLSSVYGLNGISYFFVYAFSRFVLKEKGSLLHLAGLVLIAGGIVVWSI